MEIQYDTSDTGSTAIAPDAMLVPICSIYPSPGGEHVERFKLPPSMLAKKSSSNFRKFSGKHGNHAYELEALPPETLREILRDAIDEVIDLDLFNAELDAEKQDAAKLEGLRYQIQRIMQNVGAA